MSFDSCDFSVAPSLTDEPLTDSDEFVSEDSQLSKVLNESILEIPSQTELYTRNEDGSIVGCDGYVIPRNFVEFLERHPHHIHNWVQRMLTRHVRINHNDLEDWVSEMMMFLSSLPKKSKWREQGLTDRIQTFDPDKYFGASKNRFLGYINHLLNNRFLTLLLSESRNPICRTESLVSIVTPQTLHNSPMKGTDFTDKTIREDHVDYFSTEAKDCKRVNVNLRAFVADFCKFVMHIDSSLMPIIAISAHGHNEMLITLDELGISKSEYLAKRGRVQQLAKAFTAKVGKFPCHQVGYTHV